MDKKIAGPLIDGRITPSSSERTIPVINPYNNSDVLDLPEGSVDDVDRATASARKTAERGDWGQEAASHRKRILTRFAELIAEEAEALDALDAEEMGKPISTAFCNSLAAADIVRFYAECIDKVYGDVLAADRNNLSVLRRVPRGVVAALTPWNFPAFCAALKVAPALAAGNSVILKPSEMSTRSALKIADLALEAGIPPGVFNVVPGRGEIVGRALAEHPDVDMLTFTGSTEVGKLIMQYAGRSNMKVVMAECGGKSPQIIFNDHVDLDVASAAIAEKLTTNQGQICSVGSRLLVETSIVDVVCDKVAKRLSSVKMGNPLDASTTFGPVASARQCERVMQYIIGTRERQDGRLCMGGERALLGTAANFIEPTLFRDVNPHAQIAQEEVFGPVLSLIPFSDENEAVEIANGTPYGLVAYVWTADLGRAMRMAKAIRSSIFVNSAQPAGEGAGSALSSEPCGQSGFGAEGGIAGLESYTRRQFINFGHQ